MADLRDVYFVAIGSLLLSIFIPLLISDWYNENFGKTQQRLVGLWKCDKINEFNDLRKQINQSIEFDGIDLSEICIIKFF